MPKSNKPANKPATVKAPAVKAPAKPAAAPKPEAPKAPALDDATKASISAEAHAKVRALSARSCACGCGTPTKSTFAPGHDARLYSKLVKEATDAALAKLTRDGVRGKAA